MAILFALIALVGWGVGDIFVTIASRKIGNAITFFWWLVIGLFMGLVYLPFAGSLTSWKMFAIAYGLNVFASIGTLAFFKALEIGNASLTSTIAGSFPLITVPLSIILFHENLSTLQVIGIIFILVGLILGSLKEDAIKEIRSGKIFSDRGVLYALITLLIWGIYWAVVRIPIESIGWYYTGFSGSLVFILLPLFGLIKKNPIKELVKKDVYPIVVLASVITIIGSYAYNLGLTFGYSSIVAPIAGLSPVLFVIIAHFVFKEALSRRQLVGIATSLAGIALISFS